MYDKMGLKDEDEREERKRKESCRTRATDGAADECVDAHAALSYVEYLPDERVIVCDRKNPIMKLGSMYKDMNEFRLAMRQYAINHEFELDLKSSTPFRYSAGCKGDGCPWRIHAKPQVQGSPTIIVCFLVINFRLFLMLTNN